MTPNQIDGIADTIRQLLRSGHEQGLAPTTGPVFVTEHAYGNGAYVVYTEWVEPEESEVTLSAIVTDDGTSSPQPAAWPDAPAQIPNLPTDCVVCDGAGCEHCPKVSA